MNSIKTTLTTSGNSVAVRLPKALLKMSGLSNNVMLEAKQGKIIISKPANPREGWDEQIDALILAGGGDTDDFADMDVAAHDGLKDLPWEGPSYEDWQKNNAGAS